jgi:hypothetical protein
MDEIEDDYTVDRIQVDGMRTRRPTGFGAVVRPMAQYIATETTWATSRWRPRAMTEEELDQWVRTDEWPEWMGEL